MREKCASCGKKVGLISGGYEFGYKTYCRKCYDACKFVIDEPVKLTNNQVIRNSHLINQESNSAALTDAEAWHATQTMMGGNGIDSSGM